MKPVPNFPDYYCSKDGDIFSSKGKTLKKLNSTIKKYKQAYRKARLYVTLRKNNKSYRKFVHQVVMLTFVGDYPEGKEINHIDGNPLNNKLENLEYVSSSENTRHAFKNGLNKNAGDNHYIAKLDDIKVLTILTLEENSNLTKLSEHFKVARSTIQDVVKNRTWKHIPRE